MQSLAVRNLLASHDWSQLFFTTYSLSLSFFEAIVLDTIVRKQVGSALVLADESGVRNSLAEFGAQNVGRAYFLEPVSVSGGCFHPKMTAMISEEECHLLVGSGNLTFGGWGSNLECIEHLHPSFAASAFQDAADFLIAISDSPRLRHAVNGDCLDLASKLSARAKQAVPNQDIRLLHTLHRSIPEQIAGFAEELGGAKSLIAASPFYDARGIELLCRSLALTHASLHSHEFGTVLGDAGSNWPTGSSHDYARAVSVEALASDSRRLHGKLFEVVCKRGRLLVSGSSNGTAAGLVAGANVELNVLRIEREAFVAWSFSPSVPPPRLEPVESPAKDGIHPGVLRATLRAGEIEAQVVTGFPEGEAQLLHRSGLAWKPLGLVSVESGGRFSFKLSDPWMLTGTQQCVLRVVAENGRRAEGFASLPEYGEISRRLGAASHHFFSFLLGRETPRDIDAILEFIRLHPDWLPKEPDIAAGGKRQTTEDASGQIVKLSDLSVVHHQYTSGGQLHQDQLFMQAVIAAFRQKRGPLDPGNPLNDDPGQDGPPGEVQEEQEEEDKESASALAALDRLLNVLIDCPAEERHCVRAAEITQYVCERLSLDQSLVRVYMERLVKSFERPLQDPADREFFAALALVWAANLSGTQEENAITLRRQFLRLDMNIPSDIPDLTPVARFGDFLPASSFQDLWLSAQTATTMQEEMKLFWSSEAPPGELELPLLRSSAFWEPRLQFGREGVVRMKRYTAYCTHCYTMLSAVEAAKLKSSGIAQCQRGQILLCEEY